MKETTWILWEAAGRPRGQGDEPGVCRVCGQDGTGLPFDDWARPTFTDWDKLVTGKILCHACQFSFEERSEQLAQLVGKEKPQRMRNYSHFVAGGEWIPLSKSDKSTMADILLHQDWQIAVIAESGQKHILFRATPGVVQFEEQQLPDLSDLGGLLATIQALYTGFSKAEIETGRYRQHRIRKFGLEKWRELEMKITHRREELLFKLALFLAQKGAEGDRTAREGGDIAGDHLAGGAEGLQEPLPDEHLATVRGQREKRGVYEQPGQIRQLALLQTASADRRKRR